MDIRDRVTSLEQEVAVLTETVKSLSGYLQCMVQNHNQIVAHVEKNFATTNSNFSHMMNAIGDLVDSVAEIRDGEGEEWKHGSVD